MYKYGLLYASGPASSRTRATQLIAHPRISGDFEDFLRDEGRLLDDSDPSVTLATISRTALALGKQVRLKLAA